MSGTKCALILAGGHSSRMGTDKCLLPMEGQTMLERAAAFWQTCGRVDRVLIACGREDHFAQLPAGTEAVTDLYPELGPMAGIHAAFAQTDAELLWVSGVDMPYLDRDMILPPPEGDAAVYRRNGRPEPLFGVYRRSVYPIMDECLRAGNSRMMALLNRVNTSFVDVPENSPVFRNMNTPKDWAKAAAGMPPMVVFMGWSGSGKTTFLEKLIPELTGRGLRVAVIKHDGHGFQMDKPGKDTWRFAQAGAVCTAISGPGQWAVLGRGDIELQDFRAKLPPCDLILVEGHKYSALPKFEVHRKETGKPFITFDHSLVAAITDEPVPVKAPQLGLDDVKACADLIIETFLK